MLYAQIILTVLAVASSVSGRGYGPGVGIPGGTYGGISAGGMTGIGFSAAGGLTGSSYGSISGAGAGIYGLSMAPKPYKVSYQASDEQGGVQFKTESGDGNGSVQGMYGYRDAQGLYRIVEYIADEKGYRAAVNTNEPGVDGNENPADVVMTVEVPPAGIQEKYTPAANHWGTGPVSSASGGGAFGNGRPVVGGQVSTGVYGSMGGKSSVPGTAGSFGSSSGLFTGIPKSTSGKSAY